MVYPPSLPMHVKRLLPCSNGCSGEAESDQSHGWGFAENSRCESHHISLARQPVSRNHLVHKSEEKKLNKYSLKRADHQSSWREGCDGSLVVRKWLRLNAYV
jgi:hypothetical protein